MNLLTRILNWIRRRSLGPVPPSGYYYTYSYDYGDWIDAIPQGHELAYVAMEHATRETFASVAARLARRQMKAVYHARESPFQWGTWTLHPDWQARLAAQLPLIEEFRQRGAWHSWYVMDEPGTRVRREDLTVVCRWLRDHGITTSMVDTAGPGLGTWRAQLVTYYGLDAYDQDPNGNWSVNWTLAERWLRETGANMVVGQAFNGPGWPLPDPYPAVRVARAINAKALLWFLWPSLPGGLDGASSSPETVRAIQRASTRPRAWMTNIAEKSQ